MSGKDFITHHPILSYFGLAFVIVWAGSYIVAGSKVSQGISLNISDIWPIVLLMFFTPSLVGVVLTYIVDGETGLRTLLAGLKRWGVRAQWYAALLIFPVLILTAQLGLYYSISPDFLPNFLPMGILIGLCAGFLEEIGWMGFAFPRMSRLCSPLEAGLLLGLLHVLWHLAADYLTTSGSKGAHWLPHFLAFCVAMVAMRVILVWIYVNTKSLLLAQLAHASSTGFLAVLVPLSLSPSQSTIFYIVYGVMLWITAILIVVKFGKRLVALG